jgi:hypothetical protein
VPAKGVKMKERMGLSPAKWPGWAFDDNPYGLGFDEAARKRMLAVSALIDPVLQQYLPTRAAVEIGPLFNPHVHPRDVEETLTYVEKDIHAGRYLQTLSRTLVMDLNKSPKLETRIEKNSVSLVVISHVLNYVDYRTCIDSCAKITQKGGYLVISNITNHGAPEHFSKARPKSMNGIL